MKRLLTVLLTLMPLLITGQVFAQSPTVSEKRKAEVRKLIQEMNLTPDQAKSIQDIQKKYAPQRQAIEKKTLAQIQKASADKSLSQDAFKTKMAQLLKQRSAQIQPIKAKENQEMMKILSPAQQKTWQKFQKLIAEQAKVSGEVESH